MKRIVLILAILFFSNSLCFAQSTSPEKIEEFGLVSSEGLEARLDYMVNTARQNPTKTIKTIIYRAINKPMGFTHRFGAIILAYANRYKIERGRFSYEDCGIEETQHISFYLISDNNTKSLCTKNEKTDFSKSFLFDSFYNTLWNPDNCSSCCVVACFDKETSSSSLEAFAEIIQQHPESKAFISVKWANRFSRYKNTKAKYLREIKNVFLKKGVSPSRLVIVNKEQKALGSIGIRNVELWFVAPNGFIPK